MTCNRVAETEFEGVAEKICSRHCEGGGIAPEQIQVSKPQKTSANKCVVFAENFFRVSESSARAGKFIYQVMII